jgi:hypothetical protein
MPIEFQKIDTFTKIDDNKIQVTYYQTREDLIKLYNKIVSDKNIEIEKINNKFNKKIEKVQEQLKILDTTTNIKE